MFLLAVLISWLSYILPLGSLIKFNFFKVIIGSKNLNLFHVLSIIWRVLIKNVTFIFIWFILVLTDSLPFRWLFLFEFDYLWSSSLFVAPYSFIWTFLWTLLFAHFIFKCFLDILDRILRWLLFILDFLFKVLISLVFWNKVVFITFWFKNCFKIVIILVFFNVIISTCVCLSVVNIIIFASSTTLNLWWTLMILSEISFCLLCIKMWWILLQILLNMRIIRMNNSMMIIILMWSHVSS